MRWGNERSEGPPGAYKGQEAGPSSGVLHVLSAQCRLSSVGAETGGGRSVQTNRAEGIRGASDNDAGGTQSLINSSPASVTVAFDSNAVTTGLQCAQPECSGGLLLGSGAGLGRAEEVGPSCW